MLCTTHLRVFNLAFFFLRLWIEAKPFLDNVHYCLANSKLVYTQLIKAKQSVTMYRNDIQPRLRGEERKYASGRRRRGRGIGYHLLYWKQGQCSVTNFMNPLRTTPHNPLVTLKTGVEQSGWLLPQHALVSLTWGRIRGEMVQLLGEKQDYRRLTSSRRTVETPGWWQPLRE